MIDSDVLNVAQLAFSRTEMNILYLKRLTIQSLKIFHIVLSAVSKNIIRIHQNLSVKNEEKN